MIAEVAAPSARIEDIIEPFIDQDDDQEFYSSKGLVKILVDLISYDFIVENQMKHSQGGVVTTVAETSLVSHPMDAIRYAETLWNDSINSINAIRWFCMEEDPSTYPEFDGIEFKVKFSALL